MRRVSTMLFCVLTVSCGFAESAQVPKQSCSSSPKVVINMTQLPLNASDLYVDIYRMTQRGGEIFYRSGKADAGGVAAFSDLPDGRYRVFADNGKQGAEIRLLVSKGGSKAPCEMKFSVPENLYYLPQKTVVTKDLRGVVRSSTGVAIPKAKVTLRRDGDHNPDSITLTETDHEGRFALPKLAEGWYWATFEPPKEFCQFCRISIQVKVAADGWTDMKLSLAALINTAPGYCERESSLEKLNAKTN